MSTLFLTPCHTRPHSQGPHQVNGSGLPSADVHHPQQSSGPLCSYFLHSSSHTCSALAHTRRDRIKSTVLDSRQQMCITLRVYRLSLFTTSPHLLPHLSHTCPHFQGPHQINGAGLSPADVHPPQGVGHAGGSGQPRMQVTGGSQEVCLVSGGGGEGWRSREKSGQ